MHRPRSLEFAKKAKGATVASPVGMLCPHCHHFAWFDVAFSNEDRHGPPKTAKCPGCNKPLWFYVVNQPLGAGWLWVHPDPAGDVAVREDVAEALGERNSLSKEAYEEAVANHEDGRWSSAVVQVRRTLEGLVRNVLSEPADTRRMLGQMLEDLAKQHDLGDPLLATAEVVKDGGNLGSHLDFEKPADERLSRDALELVEAIVQYLLVLPVRVDALRSHIAGEAERDAAE